MACAHAAKEALWLRNVLEQLNLGSEHATVIQCDNQSSITLTRDQGHHSKTKHIDIRYHFIRDYVEMGKLYFHYIPTAENLPDIFTKALPSLKVKHFAAALGLAYV